MIIIAFFIGLIFSVPIGPLGMIMLKRSVEKGFWDGFSIAIIDSIAGFIFSLTFLIGFSQIELDPTFKLCTQVIGLLFLLFIGIKEIFFNANKQSIKKNIILNKGSLLGNLLLVIGYYISNPTLWAFWINISVYANTNLISQNSLHNYILFSFLYALGVLTTQYLAIKVMKNLDRFEKVKHTLKFVSSGLFVVTLSYFFYTSIKSLEVQWNTFAQIFQ